MDSAKFVPMECKNYLIVVAAIIGSCFLFTEAGAQDTKDKRQIEIIMRTIGHEVMLAHGDSTSRVMPVKQEGDQYFIQFDTDFVFRSSSLIEAVDKVVQRTDLVSNYLVEMQDCQTDKIIYSYQVKGEIDHNTIPCGSRAQPKACYLLRFLILEEDKIGLLAYASTNTILAFSTFLLIGIGWYNYQKKPEHQTDLHIIEIGNYVFDPRKMTLSLDNHSVVLSGKESDLLSFLHLSVNTTVERDDILRNVWGDKGDYVGRTLDVFVSKLRKKLIDDPSVKIANIRGIGYRLVVD